MQLRTMTAEDIPAGMRLKEISGWNQTAVDWKRFLSASLKGCFVVEVDGMVRGTAATISYEGKFAWVGMVLVDPQYRGKGIGTKLLERAIAYLDEAEIPTIKLDATPQGKPLYEKLGFVTEYEIERLVLKRPAPSSAVSRHLVAREFITDTQLKAIFDRDREIFGADRSGLLQTLQSDAPEFTVAVWRNGEPHGYAFGRHGSFADQLGPWVATEEKVCQDLLETFLPRCNRESVVVDCLKAHPIAGALLRAAGFNYSRPLTRMYRGTNQSSGKTESLCAILGPEFG